MQSRRLLLKYIHPLSPRPTELSRKGTLRHKIQGILFDVYGTLLISAAGDAVTQPAKKSITRLQHLLDTYQIPEPVAVVQERLVRAIDERHERLRQRRIDYPEIQIDNIWMGMTGIDNREEAAEIAMAYELIVNPVYPMPHMEKLLAACAEKKLIMGIISNAQFYTPVLLRWFLQKDLTDIGFHPSLLIFSYEFGRAKPSGHLFETAVTALKKMGLEPGQCLYVGNDMANDILPAKNAGFNTALFAGDARSLRLRRKDPACAGIEPDLVITDLIQLLEFF